MEISSHVLAWSLRDRTSSRYVTKRSLRFSLLIFAGFQNVKLQHAFASFLHSNEISNKLSAKQIIALLDGEQGQGQNLNLQIRVTDSTTSASNTYTLHERLGSGFYGIVFSATPESETHSSDKPPKKRSCAIKISKYPQGHDNAVLFKNEIERLTEIGRNVTSSENIVKLEDQGKIQFIFDGQADARHGTDELEFLCFVMPRYEGGDAWQRAVSKHLMTDDKGKATNTELAKRQIHFVKQILTGVRNAHENNTAHCDIRWENLLYEVAQTSMPADSPPDEQKEASPLSWIVYLTDFGLAQKVKESGKQLTSNRGTDRFKAPEVILRAYTKQADLWSVGIMLFQILYGICEPFMFGRDGRGFDSKEYRGNGDSAAATDAEQFLTNHADAKGDYTISSLLKHRIKQLRKKVWGCGCCPFLSWPSPCASRSADDVVELLRFLFKILKDLGEAEDIEEVERDINMKELGLETDIDEFVVDTEEEDHQAPLKHLLKNLLCCGSNRWSAEHALAFLRIGETIAQDFELLDLQIRSASTYQAKLARVNDDNKIRGQEEICIITINKIFSPGSSETSTATSPTAEEHKYPHKDGREEYLISHDHSATLP